MLLVVTELKATCNDVDEVLKTITTRKEQEDKDEKEFQVSIYTKLSNIHYMTQCKYGARDESQVCKELWHELDACLKFHQKAVSLCHISLN